MAHFLTAIGSLMAISPLLNSAPNTLLFLTGYSGAGKSTLASHIAKKLSKVEVLDGDAVRKAYKDDLPHGPAGRVENTRRLAQLAIRYLQTTSHVIAAYVSPDAKLRAFVKTEVEEAGFRFVEVWVDTSIETCKKRDTKGLYGRLDKGEDIHLAGINDPYNKPRNPNVICTTDTKSIADCVNQVLEYLSSSKPPQLKS